MTGTPTDARARHGLGRLGLPVVGRGVALFTKVVILNGALGVIGGSPTPLRIALVLGVLLALAAVVRLDRSGPRDPQSPGPHQDGAAGRPPRLGAPGGASRGLAGRAVAPLRRA